MIGEHIYNGYLNSLFIFVVILTKRKEIVMITNIQEPKKYAQTVRDLVQDRTCLKFSIHDKLSDVLQRIRTHNGCAGGVIDSKGKLIGLISEREIVRKALEIPIKATDEIYDFSLEKKKADLTAWQLMIANPDALHIDDDIDDALDIITYHGYRYMPVTDHKGQCMGIVDARELHRHVEAKTEDIIQSKDALLSYFLHTEPYGKGVSL
jgi:predicted transcriptional regulator